MELYFGVIRSFEKLESEDEYSLVFFSELVHLDKDWKGLVSSGVKSDALLLLFRCKWHLLLGCNVYNLLYTYHAGLSC